MIEAQSKYRRQFLMFAGASVLLLTLALFLSWNNARLARAAGAQSIHFYHNKHVKAGAQCVYCHPGVIDGAVAGLPSTAKCMGCHVNVEVSPPGQSQVAILFDHAETGERLEWVKRVDQPDFVYYSHRPHISAGIACEECHGDVSEMAEFQQTIVLNMGFCLACHRDQGEIKAKRLETCSTCHK